MADNEPTLTGIPPELREIIWSYLVAFDEPLVAYVKRRTIAAPREKREPG